MGYSEYEVQKMMDARLFLDRQEQEEIARAVGVTVDVLYATLEDKRYEEAGDVNRGRIKAIYLGRWLFGEKKWLGKQPGGFSDPRVYYSKKKEKGIVNKVIRDDVFAILKAECVVLYYALDDSS